MDTSEIFLSCLEEAVAGSAGKERNEKGQINSVPHLIHIILLFSSPSVCIPFLSPASEKQSMIRLFSSL